MRFTSSGWVRPMPDAQIPEIFYFCQLPRLMRSSGRCRAGRGGPEAQGAGAEVTRLVRTVRAGRGAADYHSLFSGDLLTLAEADLQQLRQDGLPAPRCAARNCLETLTHLLVEAGIAGSVSRSRTRWDAVQSQLQQQGRFLGDNAQVRACLDASLAGCLAVTSWCAWAGKYHLFEGGTRACPVALGAVGSKTAVQYP